MTMEPFGVAFLCVVLLAVFAGVWMFMGRSFGWLMNISDAAHLQRQSHLRIDACTGSVSRPFPSCTADGWTVCTTF
jgi:hypothetical protein